MKRLFHFSIWLLMLCAITCAASAEDDQRSVLFIAVDDLSTRLHCYGVNHMQTPSIDALAARGVRFDRAYCQYPSCGPSRASLLTGLRPNTTRILANRDRFRQYVPDAVTLPQYFRRQGYHVARVGKIFHQNVPTDIGTSGDDDPASWDEVVNPRGCDKDEEDRLTDYTPFLQLPDRMSYYQSDSTDAEQTDGKIADETIRLLEKHAGRPFFLAAGFYRPHIPYIAPKEYFARYSLERTLLPKLPQDYRKTVPDAAFASTPVWPNFGTTEQQARECILAYDASVTFVDAQISRLLAALDRLKLTDRTIVVLCGDHGYHLGEHGLWRKNSLFEESARAPLIIAAPHLAPSSRVCPNPVEFIDVFPTVVVAAGLPLPSGLEGRSLLPLLRDPAQSWNYPAYTQVQFGPIPGRSVRTARWRYTEWGTGGKDGIELYDEANDPQEINNLASAPAQAAVRAELKQLLK